MKDRNSLSHTRWNCKYHVVFAPKYRRQEIYGKIKTDLGTILRRLCEYKGIEILEASLCKDHVHMLLSIPPKYSVSSIVGYLKGKSSLMMLTRDYASTAAHRKMQRICTAARKEAVFLA